MAAENDGMWKTVSRTKVLQRGRWLTLEEHKVELPDGKTIPDWTWVVTPNFINVAVLAKEPLSAQSPPAGPDGARWILFRQPKYAVGVSLNIAQTLGTVGGYVEANEDPLEAAKRELLEEMGFVADEWIHLGSMVPDANRGCGIGHLYFAVGCCRPVNAPSAPNLHDDLEEQVMTELTTDQLEQELLDNKSIAVHSWSSTMSLALLHWKRKLAKKST